MDFEALTGGVVVGFCVADLHGAMEKSHLCSLDNHPLTQTHVNEENEPFSEHLMK